jgi:hypothetical protein
MLRLRDPTTIGVIPSTRRVGEVEGAEERTSRWEGKDATHTGRRRTEPCPSVSFIFSCIYYMYLDSIMRRGNPPHGNFIDLC